MRLVYLASSTLPSKGADAVHVMNMCKAFAESGLEVTLIARSNSQNREDVFKYYGIDIGLFKLELVSRPNIRILGGFIFGLRVAAIFKKIEKPNIIYARSIHSLIRINSKNIPFFFESHWKPQNKLYYNWEKRLLRKKNLKSFIFISKGLENIYKDLFPKSIEKFNILHDACNIPEESLKIIKSRNNRLQVGYVGSFFEGNGFNIIPKLAKRMKEVDFHIVGGKDPILSELKEKYKLNNLIFYGHVPHSKISSIYNKIDIALSPYQKSLPHIKWVSPMKIFEYMSYKKAIISSDFPVIREVLNNDNSILVKSDDIEAWCMAIEKMKNKKLRETLIDNAYKLFIENYTWRARAKEIIKLIN